jgi:hypothetical protein
VDVFCDGTEMAWEAEGSPKPDMSGAHQPLTTDQLGRASPAGLDDFP